MSPRRCRGCDKPLPPLRGRQLGSRWHPWCRGAKQRAERVRATRALIEGRGPRRGPAHPAWRGGPVVRKQTVAWTRLSRAIRQAWSHCCARCGRPEAENVGRDGTPRALALDHVRPYRLAGEDTTYAPLCLWCHGRKGQIERKAFWRGDVLAQRRYERLVAAP